MQHKETRWGIRDLFADAVDAPAELDLAVEAVLGDKILAIGEDRFGVLHDLQPLEAVVVIGAHADAEQDELPSLVRPAGSKLIDYRGKILPLEKAGGAIAAIAFAVCAGVDGQNMKAKLVPKRRPGNGANFRIGISVHQDDALIAMR